MQTKPSPPQVSGGLPILGHAVEFHRTPNDIMNRGYREHGPLFSFKLANQNVAVLAGVEHQRTFFAKTDKGLNIQKPYTFLQAMFGDALFLAPHDKYLEQRPMVTELFRRKKMLEYIDIMQEQVQKMVDGWGDSGEIELTGAINHLVQEVAGSCFLGKDLHAQVGREFWDHYAVLGAALDPLLPPHWPLPKFIKRDRAKAQMKQILRPIIAERRANPDRYDDMIKDMVVYANELGEAITDDTILNLLLGLMFAGHETTAGQGAWSVIQLLQHPSYLALVQEEIDTHTTAGERFDHRTMAKLKHVAQAVRETERMKPSAEFLMRVVEEPLEIGDYVVPEGWLTLVSADVAHHLEEIWQEPDRYDPMRFSPERAEDKQDRFTLIGFGGGTHKCTGMNFANNEMIIIVTLLFQQFDLELVTQDPQVNRDTGTCRPEKTIVRYKRKAAGGATKPVDEGALAVAS